MPYGDLTPYRDTNVEPRSTAWPEPALRQGFRVGIVSLALATLMSFAAGVGSTVVYFQSVNVVPLAALPLVEADKTPSRVRPEGLDGNGNRMMASTPAPTGPSLPSPISSALAAAGDPAVDLTPQGIPSAPEIEPPLAAAVIELAPQAPAAPSAVQAAPVQPVETALAPARSGEQFRLQLATMRSSDGARQEMNRLNVLYANLTPVLELSVQRLEQGERGVFYRVLSEPVGERGDAAQLCAAIAERRGQCRIVAAPGTAIAQAAKPAAPIVAAVQTPAPPPSPVVAAAPVAPPASPAAAVIAAKTAAMESRAPAPSNAALANGISGVRAQLGSMRSPEGAARELARLKEVHADALTSTELTVSKIDQGDRGVFYRILTAPLPDRASASEFCKSLGPQHGCVLIPQRPSA